MTKYRCLNCPTRPVFTDLDSLKEHWSKTHTVPMEHTAAELLGGSIHPLIAGLLGDKINTTIKLTEAIKEVTE